jgi:3-deoxy-7-phosphoheptulonate synthase
MEEFKKKRLWGPEPNYPLCEKYKPAYQFYELAGPCFVESEKQIFQIAKEVARCGAKYLRGGVYRAGTYPPKDFGFLKDRFVMKAAAAATYGLKTVTEMIEYDHLLIRACNYNSNVFQVGARQMQNYPLLRTLAELGKTIFLKRNMGSNIHEWLGAAEYILKYGGKPVLVERGSATQMNHVRWDLSISAIPAVKAINPNMPIIVDASHGTGRRDLVAPMTLAGIASGSDGYLIEVHQNPSKSLSDADQAYPLKDFESLHQKIHELRDLRDTWKI